MVRKPDTEKRTLFLETALRLFAENGIQNTSTAAISKAAGTAAGTLFLYFPTRQALIDELVIRAAEQRAGFISHQIEEPGLNLRETFFRIWRASILSFLEDPRLFTFTQEVRHANLVGQEVMRKTGELFSFYYTNIARGQQEGLIQPYSADLIGTFLFQDITAGTMAALAAEDEKSREEIIRIGFEIFWNGIAARA